MPRDVVGDAVAATTTALTDAIITNLGKIPQKGQARDRKPIQLPRISADPDFVKTKQRRVVGIDVFVETNLLPDALGKAVEKLVEGSVVKLKMVSSRGTQVYPSTGAITDVVDQYRCRLMLRDEKASLEDDQLLPLLQKFQGPYRWAHLEKLQEFDGAAGFTKAQGES